MSSSDSWVGDGVPCFAVVGKVNTGKSSVLATLLEQDDERVVRISSTPGETTRCQRLGLKVGVEERLRFIDTPGFSDAVGAMREIQAIHGSGTPGLESVRAFFERYRGGDKFADECLLLEPVLEGAGILYVVDSSRPMKERYVAEMEILRWTGRQRMALMNPQGDGEFYAEWKMRLGSFFNLVRTFNAHTARYGERVGLLRAMAEMDEEHAGVIGEVLRALENEWEVRREDAADLMQGFVEEVLGMTCSRQVEGDYPEHERKFKRVRDELRTEWLGLLEKREKGVLKKLLEIYKHSRLEAGGSLKMEATDLSAEETWRKWGLDRKQLVTAAAFTGGAAGFAVDVASGGLTHGAGTVIGFLGGGAAAFFGGDELPDVDFSFSKGVGLKKGGARSLEVGAPKNEQFPWVLLDSLLSAYRGILEWTHARREEEAFSGKGPSGRVTRFGGERRRLLAKWVGAARKGKVDGELSGLVFREFCLILEEVEG